MTSPLECIRCPVKYKALCFKHRFEHKKALLWWMICVVIFGALLFLTTLPSHAYGEVYPYNVNWYTRVDKSEYANADRKSFDPPAVGTKAKELNKLQRILYRANKRHVSAWNRYYPHISDREYRDCTYYKYVDCSNFAFCRCWQCRNYAYPIERVDY